MGMMLGAMECGPAHTGVTALPPPIVIGCRGAELDDLLSQEWLIANDIGAYASGTAAGCNTRRYHGLLVAVTVPPVGRVVALAHLMEDTVRRHLLTPVGLRTLSPEDPAYCGQSGGDAESRDRTYHQGTVWPWLIGPFIEAYLKVERHSPTAVAQAKQWLAAFDAHLAQAGLGFISEVFDGDPPHMPGGCIAQAWSVAEVLRAKLLVQSGG